MTPGKTRPRTPSEVVEARHRMTPGKARPRMPSEEVEARRQPLQRVWQIQSQSCGSPSQPRAQAQMLGEPIQPPQESLGWVSLPPSPERWLGDAIRHRNGDRDGAMAARPHARTARRAPASRSTGARHWHRCRLSLPVAPRAAMDKAASANAPV